MKLSVLDNVKSIFFTVLESIENLLKQNSTKKEIGKVFTSTNPKPKKERPPKDVYSYKGSANKAKGSVNTDAATFNHPRKDVPQGRSH